MKWLSAWLLLAWCVPSGAAPGPDAWYEKNASWAGTMTEARERYRAWLRDGGTADAKAPAALVPWRRAESDFPRESEWLIRDRQGSRFYRWWSAKERARDEEYNRVALEWCTPCDNGMFMSGGRFLKNDEDQA